MNKIKLVEKTCIEVGCNKKFKVRPQHFKICKRCPVCQQKYNRAYYTDLQRGRRIKKREEEKKRKEEEERKKREEEEEKTS